jgi:hypothetical protein
MVADVCVVWWVDDALRLKRARAAMQTFANGL